MTRFTTMMLAAATAGLLASVALPANSAPAGRAEIVSSGGLVQTAAKKAKPAKKAKKAAAKSCGTYKYADKKGKCVDARDKKK